MPSIIIQIIIAGKDMFESTQIIAKRQFQKAHELLNIPAEDQIELEGSVGSVFQWISMTKPKRNMTVKACPAALGYSFPAGTTDGPGVFNFIQGTNTTNPFWEFVNDILKEPSPEQIACHAPKPILIDAGQINFPFKVSILKLVST